MRSRSRSSGGGPPHPRTTPAVSFDATGVEVSHGSSRWRPQASRWGCQGRLVDLASRGASAPEVAANRAVYHRGGLDESYVVGRLGIEQGFTLRTAPACARVAIELAKPAALAVRPHADGGVSFHDASGRERLRYSALFVVDAKGRELPSSLVLRDGAVVIDFDARDAVYPVTVDPLIWVSAQKLTASDAADEDFFGNAIAIDGTTAMIVAFGKASSEGQVYVFTHYRPAARVCYWTDRLGGTGTRGCHRRSRRARLGPRPPPSVVKRPSRRRPRRARRQRRSCSRSKPGRARSGRPPPAHRFDRAASSASARSPSPERSAGRRGSPGCR